MTNRNIDFGYSTYAMPKIDAFEAIPKLSSIGYKIVELCVADSKTSSLNFDWKTNLSNIQSSWKEIKDISISEGLKAPSLFDMFSVCADTSNRQEAMDRVKRTCELASNLNYERDHGVVVSTLGHPEPDLSWGLSTLLRDQKKPIIDGLREIGDIASEFNVIIGLEPHVGNLIDTPEKGAWAITQANHNNIKLDFDISHFICQGIDVQHSFNLCAKYAGAVHIKDGYMENGKVVFQLPGEGALNLTEYLDKIVEFKLSHLPVFAEVSFQLYTKDNYDEWKTAEDCYKYFSEA